MVTKLITEYHVLPYTDKEWDVSETPRWAKVVREGEHWVVIPYRFNTKDAEPLLFATRRKANKAARIWVQDEKWEVGG